MGSVRRAGEPYARGRGRAASVVPGGLAPFLEEMTPVDSVGEVADAEALLQVTASQRPDLILLDAALPRPPRLAILRHCVYTLRTLHPPVYIIVLCGNGEKLEEVRTIGADAWVSKAESPDRLLAALQQAGG